MLVKDISAGSDKGTDDEQTAATGVGALLRASRVRCGESIADVSEALCIRQRFLEAIEDGRFGDLPAPTYAVGFVRGFADHLGLDAREVVRRFKEETNQGRPSTRLEFPEPIPETGIPGAAVLFVALLVVVAAYGAWYLGTENDGLITELISPAPHRLEAPGRVEQRSADAASGATGVAAPPAPAEAANGGATPAASAATESAATESTASEDRVTAAAREHLPTAAAPAQTDSATGQQSVSPPQPTAEPVAEPPVPSLPATEAAVPQASTAQASTAQTPAIAEPLGEEAAVKPDMAPASPAVAGPQATDTTQLANAPPATEPTLAAPGPAGPGPAAPGPAASEPAATATGAPVSRVFGVPSGEQARIVVRALSDSWIQVRDDVASRLLLTRLLRKGDSYRVPDRQGLVLLTGNAGALEVVVDGAVAPAIGPEGAVRRGVALDPRRLAQGTAIQ